MPSPDIKSRLKLEGEAEFKRGMSDAASAIKTLNSEQKLAAAQFEATGDAEQYAADKARILREKINEQQKAVASAEAAVKALKDQGVDPNSKAMQTWRTKLNNAKTALTKMETELNDTERELGEQGQAFSDTEGDAKGYQDQMDKIAKGVDFTATINAIDNVRERIGTVIQTAGRAAKSMWNLERGAAGWADELVTNAAIADMDVIKFQGYEYAAQMVDTSVDTITKSLKKLGAGLDEPTDNFLESLNEIGVTNLDALTGRARQTEDVFWDVVDVMGTIDNASRRDQIAMELFGRSFDELRPLFNAGSKAWKEWAKVGEEHAVSEESIAKLTGLDDTLNDLNARFDQTKYTVLSELAPAFEAAATAATGALAAFNDFIDSEEGQQSLQGLRDSIAGIGEDLAKVDWKSAMDTAAGAIKGVVDGLAWLLDHKVVVIAAIGGMAGAWAGLTVSKDVLSVLQLLNTVKWSRLEKLARVQEAPAAAANATAGKATGTTAANALKTAGTAGSAIGGAAGLAAIVGGFIWAGNERNTNESIRGSAQAIEDATQGSAELKEAFIAYVEAQRDLQSLMDQGVTDEGAANSAIDRADAATEALQKLEGYKDVLDAYSAWRQENSLGNMEWVIPDNLDEVTGFMTDIKADVNSTAAEMPALGGNIPSGLAEGIYANGQAAIAAAEWLGSAISGAVSATLQIQSPSRVMMGLGEYVSEGFAEGIENNISRVERATSRMVAATTSRPVSQSAPQGAAPGKGQMVHITMVLDGREVGDVITPYVDGAIGTTVSRRR